MLSSGSLRLCCWTITAMLYLMPFPCRGGIIDLVTFGSGESEQAHGLTAEHSDVTVGGLGESARRLLAHRKKHWSGGRLSFTLNVDSNRQNYVTVRLWGADVNSNRLILFCEGRQIGYRHLGDYEILDVGSTEPACNGRFFYRTTPLPLNLTSGRTNLNFEIHSTGSIWGYADKFDQYQKSMTEPSRGIYGFYSHTDGCFIPPAGEKQGACPAAVPVRKMPGPEVIDEVKNRINNELNGILDSKKPINQLQMHFLARAWHTPWTTAAGNPKVIEEVVAGIDNLYLLFQKDKKLVRADPSTPNPEWFATGLAADAVRLLEEKIQPFLDQPLDKKRSMTRRMAWSVMFLDGREWLRRHRRVCTNQSMIIDLNIYRCNSGIAVIDPASALPEEAATQYLDEAIGVRPWLGSETDDGPEKPMGDGYFQTTRHGLTRELGYAGNYGEVLDWVTQIYDATRAPGQPGDPVVKAQLAKITRARAVFRYPALDAGGNRAMRLETVIGWRDDHYPGGVVYGQRVGWDGSALYAAAATMDEHGIAYARQMIDDNQFFASVEEQLKSGGLRASAGLLGIPEQYDLVKSLPPGPRRLPMTAGQKDFIFSDEENGVVAVKRGSEILYVSLYWRARYGVNFLARIHHINPRFERIAAVRQQVVFDNSGMEYTRPDWINFGFGNGGPKYPGRIRSAHAGEKLPIAKIPEGVSFKPGQESVYAGKGSFYQLYYGPYIIGMNCTTGTTYRMGWPLNAGLVQDLVENREQKPDAAGGLLVAPLSTAVLYVHPPAVSLKNAR